MAMAESHQMRRGDTMSVARENEIRAAIFGAGQAGAMAAKWLPENVRLLAFIDNSAKKQETAVNRLPVMSLDAAIHIGLDEIIIAVINPEAAEAVAAQISESGFKGKVMSAGDVRNFQDLRLASMRLIAEEIKKRGIGGAIAELGVYRGDFASAMSREFPDRRFYLFDTFEGFSSKDLAIEEAVSGPAGHHNDFKDTSEELVREKILYPDRAVICKGYFPVSIPREAEEEKYAFVSLDPDLYEPTKQGLRFFYPRLMRGGVILVHDYNSLQFQGVRRAVDEYLLEYQLSAIPLPDLHGSCVIMKM